MTSHAAMIIEKFGDVEFNCEANQKHQKIVLYLEGVPVQLRSLRNLRLSTVNSEETNYNASMKMYCIDIELPSSGEIIGKTREVEYKQREEAN